MISFGCGTYHDFSEPIYKYDEVMFLIAEINDKDCLNVLMDVLRDDKDKYTEDEILEISILYAIKYDNL